ncbi:hypothetical protein BMF94_4518 [Rhodotorula taiwanensis]|uniref:Haloacid dehalogenase n=1 Tax=Rhodotorula taiwanensis TaxID=741276 RepID=A0A2S5B7E3_9BASI|nr:hypothetical protein BMF94_4518 [Rhodotorula taiwanensis]
MAPESRPRIRAVLMDQFGTLTDQHGSMTRQLEQCGAASDLGGVDWSVFAERWRAGYLRRTREIAAGASGPSDVDELHLELLDKLLEEKEYDKVAEQWSPDKRRQICQFWHKLDAWPDTKPGLDAVRQLEPPVLLATLSNGTLRLLVDIARHNNLPIDAHFSGDLLQSYKPNPRMYCRAAELLGFDAAARQRGEVAMFASHIDDLLAAKEQGLYTIYIRRPTEDTSERRDSVKTFADGGEVDVIIESMAELAEHLQ